jgi:hypothetical protein
VFTAPVTGNYAFSGNIGISNIGVAHTEAIFKMNISGKGFNVSRVNPATAGGISGLLILSFSIVWPMTASDSAQIQVTVSNGTKVITVLGDGTNPITYFSGTLLPA